MSPDPQHVDPVELLTPDLSGVPQTDDAEAPDAGPDHAGIAPDDEVEE